MIILTSSVSKRFDFEMFSVFTKTQSLHFKFLQFEQRFKFKKLRCRDGLVWTEGLKGETKLCFQSPVLRLRACLQGRRATLASGVTLP